MNLYFVEKFSEGDTDAQLEAMRRVFKLTDLKEADIIFCASIVHMNRAMDAKLSSYKPLVVYCWDYYKWAHEGKHHNHNWSAYAQFLKMADAVIVPSVAQQRRLKELLGLDSFVVKTGFPTYDLPVSDKGFILDPLRYYPEENRTWAEDAARELGIPIIHSEHRYSLEEFRQLVASCTFMTSCVREASTGALTLMEGLWLGKPSLVSDSPYMGAVDYVGDYGVYFKHDDFDDLKSKMKKLWDERLTYDTKETRLYIHKSFSYHEMAYNIFNICESTLARVGK